MLVDFDYLRLIEEILQCKWLSERAHHLNVCELSGRCLRGVFTMRLGIILIDIILSLRGGLCLRKGITTSFTLSELS